MKMEAARDIWRSVRGRLAVEAEAPSERETGQFRPPWHHPQWNTLSHEQHHQGLDRLGYQTPGRPHAYYSGNVEHARSGTRLQRTTTYQEWSGWDNASPVVIHRSPTSLDMPKRRT